MPCWGAETPRGTGVGGRASSCPRAGGGERVTPELRGWGTAEHAVPSATGRLRVWSLSAECAAA